MLKMTNVCSTKGLRLSNFNWQLVIGTKVKSFKDNVEVCAFRRIGISLKVSRALRLVRILLVEKDLRFNTLAIFNLSNSCQPAAYLPVSLQF